MDEKESSGEIIRTMKGNLRNPRQKIGGRLPDSTEVIGAGETAYVPHSPFGAVVRPPVKFAEDVPFVQNGETDMFEKLADIFPGRYGFVDPGVGAGISAKNKGIFPGYSRGCGFDPALSAVNRVFILQENYDRVRRMPLVGGKPQTDQIISKIINICSIIAFKTGDLCSLCFQSGLDREGDFFRIS
jgi:hypothetical protein